MEIWHPWRALRARPDIILRWAIFPPGTNGRIVDTGRYTIVELDGRLRYEGRRCTLTHELIHHERGILPRDAPEYLRVKDEAQVRAETARRLVPLDKLRAFVAQRTTVGAITAQDVADEFDVTLEVAREACRLAS